MSKHRIVVEIEADQDCGPEGFPLELAQRISEVIDREYMAGGEDLMGYEGPMVTFSSVTVTPPRDRP